MAGVNVGGVNIQFGVDLSVLEEGVKEAQSIVSGIKDAFKHITLEAAIKGDPFSEMKNYSNKANGILNDVFNSFANTVEEANRKSIASLTSLEKEFYKLGQAARKNAETVAKEYQNIIGASETLSKLTPANISPIEKFASKDIRSAESRKKFRMKLFPADEINKGLVQTLESFKGYGDELDAIIDRITGKLKSFVPQDFATAQTPKYLKEMKSDFNDLYVGLNKVRTEIEKAGGGSMDEFPKKLKEAFDTSKKLAIEQKRLSEIRAAALEEERKKVDYTTKLAEAKDEEETLKKRRDLLRELTIAEAQYRSNIAAGIEVEKNREALIKSLERKKDVLGGKLGVADQSSLEAANRKRTLSIIEKENEARREELRLASSQEEALKRRIALQHKLVVEGKKLGASYALAKTEEERSEISRGILKNLENRLKAGITMTPKLTQKLEELRKRFEKPLDKDGFLTKRWFQVRAKWFLELRGLWGFYRSAIDAVKGAFEFEQAMANVKAIAQPTIEQFEKLRIKAIEIGYTTRFSAKEAADGMIILAQAGLSATEVLDSMENVAHLATATMFDLKGTAELVTTVMRSWGYEADRTKEIVDTLATSINASRLTMEGLVTAMSYVSGIAPQINLSLKETTGMLGLLSNRGLNASIAATSLRGLLSELLNPTDRFIRMLEKTGVTLQEVNPNLRSVNEILETLRVAGWDATETFKAFERRVANGAAILISNADTLKDLTERMYKVDRASQMAAENLDTVSGQWKQFKDTMVAVASVLNNEASPAIKAFIESMKLVGMGVGIILYPIVKAFGMLFQFTYDLEKGVYSNLLPSISDLNKQFLDLDIKSQNVVESFRNLRKQFSDISKLSKSSGISNVAGESAFRKLIGIAKQAKLLTDEQYNAAVKIVGQLDERKKVEESITREYENRVNLMAEEYVALKNSRIELGQIALTKLKPGLSEIVEEYKSVNKEITDIKSIRIRKQLDSSKIIGNLTPEERKDVEELIKKESISRGRSTTDQEHMKYLTRDLTRLSTKKADLEDRIRNIVGGITEPGLLDALKNDPIFKDIQSVYDQMITNVISNRKYDISKARKELNIAAGKEIEDRPYEQTKPERVKELQRLNEIDKLSIKSLEREKDRLELKRKGLINEKDIKGNLNDIFAVNSNILSIESKIQGREREIGELQIEIQEKKDDIEKTEKDLLDKLMQEANITSNIKRENEDNKAKLESVEKIVESINMRYKDRNTLLQKYKKVKETEIASDRELFEISKLVIADDLERLEILLKQDLVNEERRKLLDERNQKLNEEIDINEKLLRYDNLRYDIWKHILEKSKEFENILHIIGKQVVDELHTGLSTILQDLTGGFQEQRQEAENLKGEVAELRQESDELLSKGLLSEDEAKRFKEITNEINRLNREINKLENPINNTLEVMKKFAKEMVDSIREVINKWIAMKIVIGIGKLAGFSSVDKSSISYQFGGPGSSWLGTGGVTSANIKSFKKFSSGGMTSNPTMAILGDNPSGKELVIPSENIANNNVSGYVRGQEQPITIVNVVTPEDIASAMAGKAGERVILNAIGKDMRNRGMTTRTVKV